MSAERFFDDLARTLAEPMPRRRAVRLAAGALVAVALPTRLVSPARASMLCGADPDMPQFECNCKGAIDCCSPGEKCTCPPGAARCVNQVCPKGQQWCGGNPGNFKVQCCEPPAECEYVGPGYRCACPSQNQCTAARSGKQSCCAKGTTCCFNNMTTACCGPEQKCDATGKTATCVCKPGTGKKCGTECCGDNQECCSGECCTKGRCLPNKTCCPEGRVICNSSSGIVCCDKGEYCFFKRGVPSPRCKSGCAPGNRAGEECCGTGFKPNAKKTACVAAP